MFAPVAAHTWLWFLVLPRDTNVWSDFPSSEIDTQQSGKRGIFCSGINSNDFCGREKVCAPPPSIFPIVLHFRACSTILSLTALALPPSYRAERATITQLSSWKSKPPRSMVHRSCLFPSWECKGICANERIVIRPRSNGACSSSARGNFNPVFHWKSSWRGKGSPELLSEVRAWGCKGHRLRAAGINYSYDHRNIW